MNELRDLSLMTITKDQRRQCQRRWVGGDRSIDLPVVISFAQQHLNNTADVTAKTGGYKEMNCNGLHNASILCAEGILLL